MSEATRLPGSGAYVSRRVVALLGVVLLAVPVVTVAVILASFSGRLGSYTVVDAYLPAGANAPGLQSPVEYRDVTVGTVVSQGRPVGDGQVSIVLHLEPSAVAEIPAGVRATVAPLSIFGNQYVDLVPPPGKGSGHLRAGQVIEAVALRRAASLQSTVADFYDVLDAIHPAQLDATLTALATGLRGEGSTLGTTVSRASTYLSQMVTLLPTFETDLRLLAPVAGQLATSTPAIVRTLSNLTVTAGTLVADQSVLGQVLVGGAQVAGQGTSLVTAIAVPWEQVIADSGPLLADVSQSSTEIARVLEGLDAWSKAWAAAESQGPYLSLTSTVSVSNAADLVLASLGSPNADRLFAQGIGASLVDPPTYGGAAPPESQQQQAVAAITSALDRGRPTSSPTVATLLLSPLLDAMVHHQ